MARERNAIASDTKFSVSLHRPNKPLLSMQILQNQAYTAVFTHHCTAYMTCFLHKWRKVADILYCCQDTLTLAQRHSSAAAAAQKCFDFLHFGAVPGLSLAAYTFGLAFPWHWICLSFLRQHPPVSGRWKNKQTNRQPKNRTWPFLLGRNTVLLCIWHAGWVTPVCLMQPHTSCFSS